ncbi:unnamed protein product (macronuclear) [Paramecium tetraurelia]|uniref:protein-serine/threonine phosphatase n=1 Tax=Paramecium tetraurelia TaxID=5888 RepID=A0DHG5_PARTE|nr:uncharacterized protein GSPATT00016869001 [Paramecium tetraurelia]CAK82482.1 unnamed protein product [Paramecium tetraurelia]|eukprot:XP_001449879.1 hypothetical protein (macronuclear) [Paramecium tetraurelia strain d4-2]
MDIDKYLETLRNIRCLSERDSHLLCELAKEILVEEPNVVQVKAPVTICGGIHGQYFELLELFMNGGQIPEKSYVFNGDYVNRGHHSVETFQYLLCLKIKYPKHITLLRGNNESRILTQCDGLYEEVKRKYRNIHLWQYFCEVFDYLPLCALVNEKIFCVHGGLSPQIKQIDQIRMIDRRCAKEDEGPMSDLLWSDPQQDSDGWEESKRGAGHEFGKKVVEQFNHINGLSLIARSHQLVMEGYKYYFDKQLVSVWSVPNYCYRCGNKACIMNLDENLEQSFLFFEESQELTYNQMNQRGLPYFI